MSAPIIRGRNAVAYNPSESAFPDSKRIHHASNEAGFSTGAIQSPLSSSHQTKWTEGLSLAPVDFGSNRVKPLIYSSSSTRAKGPNIQDIIPSLNSVSHRANMKIVSPRQHSRLSQESHFPTRNWVSGYHTGSVFQSGSKPGNFEHNGFNDDSAKNSQSTDLNPVNMKADTIIEEHITSSNAEGVRGKHRSHPIWSRRDYGTDLTSDVRGYAQVGRLKPNFKAQHHSSSAPERKFLMPSFQSVRHNQDYGPHSRKLLFGRGGQAPRQRQPNHKDTSNGTDKYSPRVLKSGKWRFQSTASPRSLVQGKFRPFQRVHLFGDSYTGRTRLSDAEMGPGYVAAITSSSHGLNLTSRDISSTVKPSVTAEMSTTSPSLTSMLTKSPHAELLPQTSVNLHEGQPRGEAGVAPLLEQNKMLLVTPPMPQPETDIEENGQDDTVVSPMEIEGSGVFTDPAAAAPVNISKSSENTSKR
ncbi:uncharacterized protein LOC115379162 [Myripristis murdjan]|uniref:uncharacterized protein LOC115379162 n=1 Tax=Myripristis murdjan TaxID=586833 RepID=UPI001175CE8F|nr:uncharacterized protein LOC115379162 [Myripristis murdjan]XP_029935753.1 uncharacterized protein LOC115379162 [Myripristis murdjan]